MNSDNGIYAMDVGQYIAGIDSEYSNNGTPVNNSNREGNNIENGDTSIVGTVRRKKFACVECRQQKSKCDAVERAPDPCTKCSKKGLQCILKKDYRRTYKRARNQAIEQRFKELTKTLSNLSADEIMKKIEEEQMNLLDSRNFTKDKVEKLRLANLDAPIQEGLDKSAYFNTANTNPKEQEQHDQERKNIIIESYKMTKDQLQCQPKSLGDIYMSSEEISELFEEFATKYHPFLPVVDLSKGAERIYNLSPCLFWVILLIGLRRKFKSAELMKKLSESVKSILAEITISPIIRYTPTDNEEPILNVASVYSVQAFLLYTFWPPLTSSLSADTSWNTIGTAMFQAVRVGLNVAEFSKEYDTINSELRNEKVRTWISCNIVSQIIASSFGFPAYVSFDHTVINATRTSLSSNTSNQYIPTAIKQMAEIAHFENEIITTINSNPSETFGLVGADEKQSLLNVLGQHLNQVELKLKESNIDDIRKFLLLVTKVHLLTYYFTDATMSDSDLDNDKNALSSSPLNFESKRGLVKTYNAAISLLSHANRMWQYDAIIIKYFPGVFVLNIWQAACVVSKLSHSSLSSVLDVSKGREVYQKAVMLTFNASVLKHDMAYRSSGIMRSIWSLFSNMSERWKQENLRDNELIQKDFNLGLIIKSRMSVSVFFDCLYILKQKCGMAKLEREKEQKSEYYDEEDEALYSKAKKGTDNTEILKNGNDKKLLGLKDPEEKARKIIRTVPLDPHPINASTISSEGAIGTPNSDTEGLSLKRILNVRSPYTGRVNNLPVRASTTSPQLNSFNNKNNNNGEVSNIEQKGSITSAPATVTSIAQVPMDILDRQRINIIGDVPPLQATGETPSNDINTLINQNSSQILKDSPNSIMGSWDNWESDLVWKDVDMLMNEFAFYPSL
ncbi:hypothetical protein Kpol_1008p13 [Vanderwaltozyma polyspora DSM 70294]|uniref:Zn(2)-C6 fungal-type domain-containing protein n=1 Tax=Vanderwaltozyma polyspora (strain ATCC 22028 / DSM 70294 / BCRC 21397 / CBS 2163 / NBRC 10782 / NRRL Y-8283 / UCD 57-17) TaxID=436907 RepID=A7TPX7_VANPO|nr:uncharacterized protein Kpol_1008p13 [Vanderwaltozyma polyspora DSM 70294]EDO15675.1 hypothetical protein Kpol_1008p13 [Vanderwaltozyma polyspora DSM 70294]